MKKKKLPKPRSGKAVQASVAKTQSQRNRRGKRSIFARIRGTATGGMTTDEIMALTRGED